MKQLYREGNIDYWVKAFLTIHNSIAPKINGLPKTHKEGLPLRPVVSCVKAPAYFLAQFLSGILGMVWDNKVNIRSSEQLPEILSEIRLESTDVLVSFDVVAFFPSIPLDMAVEAVHRRWNDIQVHTPIKKEKFLEMISFCLNNSYCQYEQQFYRQKNGLAMGSPLSAIVAEFVMDPVFEDERGNFYKKKC